MSVSKIDYSQIQVLLAEVKALKAENGALRKQVRDVEEKLNTSSRNSSKAPSQDPYRKRKAKKDPSGKKQGAQEGHKGHAREVVPLEQVTELRDIYPSECPRCGGNEFAHDPISTEERQVSELPEMKRLQYSSPSW